MLEDLTWGQQKKTYDTRIRLQGFMGWLEPHDELEYRRALESQGM
jgi:hypothetical protein